jgi:hypothetical protein
MGRPTRIRNLQSKQTKTIDDISVSRIDKDGEQYIFINAVLVGHMKRYGLGRKLIIDKTWCAAGEIQLEIRDGVNK